MALLALLFGLWLWLGFHDSGRWLMLKLVFVIGLIGYHLACRVLLRALQHAAAMPSPLALRLFNEAALLLVVPIILLAVRQAVSSQPRRSTSALATTSGRITPCG